MDEGGRDENRRFQPEEQTNVADPLSPFHEPGYVKPCDPDATRVV